MVESGSAVPRGTCGGDDMVHQARERINNRETESAPRPLRRASGQRARGYPIIASSWVLSLGSGTRGSCGSALVETTQTRTEFVPIKEIEVITRYIDDVIIPHYVKGSRPCCNFILEGQDWLLFRGYHARLWPSCAETVGFVYHVDNLRRNSHL